MGRIPPSRLTIVVIDAISAIRAKSLILAIRLISANKVRDRGIGDLKFRRGGVIYEQIGQIPISPMITRI